MESVEVTELLQDVKIDDSSASVISPEINVSQAAEEKTSTIEEPDNSEAKDQQQIKSNKPLIRYSKEQLLALRESPLVKKPDGLPALSTLFGEPAKKENKRNPAEGAQENDNSKQSDYNPGDGLNKSKDETTTLGIPKSPMLTIQKSPGSSAPTSPKPPDNIVLGPPKTNFVSSSLGGLKISEEKTTTISSRSVRNDGLRQRQSEETTSYVRGNVKDFEPRAPRGPTGGRGFVGREALRERALAEKLARESKDARDARDLQNNPYGRSIGSMRSQDLTRSNRREGGTMNGKEQLGRTGTMRHQHTDERSETPEWYTYNPQIDEESKKGKEGDEDKKAFVDDIQAWKSRMKDQERKEKEKIRTERERKESNERGRARSVSRADSSVSWRAENKTVSGLEESSPVSVIPEVKENGIKEKRPLGHDDVDQLFGSAFNKFLSEHKLAMAEKSITKTSASIGDSNGDGVFSERHGELGTREQATSRFARFFSHNADENPFDADKENKKGFSVSPQNKPSPIDLLKSGPITIDTLFQSQAITSPNRPTVSPRIIPSDGKRMLSEAEVLQSLGAKTATKQNYDERSTDDIRGFNMVLAALAKSNAPEVHGPPTQSSVQPQSLDPPSYSGLPFNDPSIIIVQKPHIQEKTTQQSSKVDRSLGAPELSASDSAKKLNMLFGGNVPTSVYRQLSTRSEGGSRESSAASSPALKFNSTKPLISNYPHSPNIPQPSNMSELLPIYKSPPRPRSPVLPHHGLTHSHYQNVIPPYSNGPNIPQHSHNHPEFPPPPPLGRNIPVDQLFGMMPPRNPSQQIPPQFQPTPMPVNVPPQIPFGYRHQNDRYQQPFSGHPIPQQFPVHPHPGMIPPGTEAIFANMHGYTQFIPNLVNNAIAPNNISGIPPNANLQQRMMTLEEIERRGLGSR